MLGDVYLEYRVRSGEFISEVFGIPNQCESVMTIRFYDSMICFP